MAKDAMQHFAQKSYETFVEKYILQIPFGSAIIASVDGGNGKNRKRVQRLYRQPEASETWNLKSEFKKND